MRSVQPFIIPSLIMKFIYSSEHLFIHLHLLSTNTYWVSQCASCSVLITAAAAAKSLQSCPTLCDPTGGSPPGFPVPGILQTRTLEWVAISISNAWKWKVKMKSLSRVNSSRPHGLQPTRLLRPWDFPGKRTGMGCHCLLQCLLLEILKK